MSANVTTGEGVVKVTNETPLVAGILVAMMGKVDVMTMPMIWRVKGLIGLV